MSNYKFAGSLFATRRQMIEAIAAEFLSAGGLNDYEDVAHIFTENTDTELAAECASQWDIDCSIDDLAEAFARIRETQAHKYL